MHEVTGKEDELTSSVFSLLKYLPGDVLHTILKTSLPDCLPDGYILHRFKFWPHWDPKGTGNLNRVEPDLFLEFENKEESKPLHVIVEAKRWDKKQQNSRQWERNAQAYYNEYATKEC